MTPEQSRSVEEIVLSILSDDWYELVEFQNQLGPGDAAWKALAAEVTRLVLDGSIELRLHRPGDLPELITERSQIRALLAKRAHWNGSTYPAWWLTTYATDRGRERLHDLCIRRHDATRP